MNTEIIPSLAVVVPVYNEETSIEIFHQKLYHTLMDLKNPWEIYYINDGSIDRTEEIIYNLSDSDPRIKLINLSRNFGHQAALTCGLDHALGDVIISMDGDGQNPPELIPEMLKLYQSGYDIVVGQRLEDKTQPFFKTFTSKLFYKLINLIGNLDIPPNAADFRLLSRQVVDSLKSLPEYHRFLRGMVSWVGFKSVILPYSPHERIGGETKYTFRKMLKLAEDAIFSFSLVPLRIGLAIGGMFYLLALIEVIYVLSFWLTGNQPKLEPGWSSLMFMLLIVGGTLTTVVSFIGIYIGYIFQEVKQRPTYLIKKSRTDD